MKYALRGITAEELSYTMNRIKMDKDTKFEIKPQFSRTVRRVQENDKLWFLTLEVKVESTEDAPKPFNLNLKVFLVSSAAIKSTSLSVFMALSLRSARFPIGVATKYSIPPTILFFSVSLKSMTAFLLR